LLIMYVSKIKIDSAQALSSNRMHKDI